MAIDPKKKQIFSRIFSSNHWGDISSRSGPGSSINQTEVLRKKLPNLLSRHNVKSVLDIPCGDFHWMKEIKGELGRILDNYVGGDIVSEIVESDNAYYGDDRFSFQLLDVTVSILPNVDLIICRDCLVHFSYKDIYLALKRIKSSKSKYLLTTSFVGNQRRNSNMSTGGWRPLNFRKFPFFFPRPIDLIVEECTENGGIYADKSLVLWQVDSLNLAFLAAMVLAGKIKNGLRAIK